MIALSLILLIAFSAFFSSAEIALTSLNRMRLEKMAEDGKKTAKLADRIEDKYADALSTLLIGNNIVNTAASALATSVALTLFGGDEAKSGLVATACITVLLLIFGEIMPKMLGKRFAIPMACAYSYPLAFFMILFRPLTFLIGGFVSLLSPLWKKNGTDPDVVTEDELANIIETVEEEGVIDEDMGELLQSALDFSDITVESILTPRVDVFGIDDADSPADVFDAVVRMNHSRFPVYHENLDHITGVFYLAPFLKDVAARGIENVTVSDYVKETAYVHKTTKLPDALDKMRELKLHMIVVLDEYGGTLGVVTMEDILEEIVGEIWDETDEIEEEIVKVGENTYDVLGQTNIEDFFDEIEFRDPDFESEYTTIGGFAVEMLEEDAHEGDTFRYKNLEFTVSGMGENLVERLHVVVLSEEAEEREEDH